MGGDKRQIWTEFGEKAEYGQNMLCGILKELIEIRIVKSKHLFLKDL